MIQKKTGAELIASERTRQMASKGWTSEHDDEHRNGEMAISAVRYALEDAGREYPELLELCDARDALASAWSWESCDWKPKDPIRNLVRAGALIAAEIDRRQRTEHPSVIAEIPKSGSPPEPTGASEASSSSALTVLREALETVLQILPEPVWNEHRVLVWSRLDIEDIRTALASSREPKEHP